MADNKAKAYKTQLATMRKEVRRHIENIKDIKAYIEAGYETAPRKDDDGTKKRGKQPQPLSVRLEDNINKAIDSMSRINHAEEQLGIVLTNVAEVNDEVIYLASTRDGKRSKRNEYMQKRADLYNDLSKIVSGVEKSGVEFMSSDEGKRLIESMMEESGVLCSTFDSSFNADLLVSVNNPAFEGIVNGAKSLNEYDGSIYSTRSEYEDLEPLMKEAPVSPAKPKARTTKPAAKSTASKTNQRVRSNIDEQKEFRDKDTKAQDLQAANERMLAKAGLGSQELADVADEPKAPTKAKVGRPAKAKAPTPVEAPAPAPAPAPVAVAPASKNVDGVDYASMYFEVKAELEILSHEAKLMRAELLNVNAQLAALLKIQTIETERRQELHSA